VAGRKEHTPGAKAPLFWVRPEKAKPEGLAYLEAKDEGLGYLEAKDDGAFSSGMTERKARAKADSSPHSTSLWVRNDKQKGKDDGESDSFDLSDSFNLSGGCRER
jgi:hypothetical protein